jgi:hypothetical protein
VGSIRQVAAPKGAAARLQRLQPILRAEGVERARVAPPWMMPRVTGSIASDS